MPSNSGISIVGGGLVGSLLATVLARKNLPVTLWERRPDPRIGGAERGRSINLAVSTRGIHALSQIGLEQEILKFAVPMNGRQIHTADGVRFQPYGKEGQCIYSISRASLNHVLLDAADATGNVTTHFGKRLVDVELESGQLNFDDDTSAKSEVIIGTDGSASALRAALMANARVRCREELLDYGYKELSIEASPQGTHRLEKNALHIWPRGTYMLIALPNFDGSFTCTLFLPFQGKTSFANLETPSQVREFFHRDFPDVVPLFPNLVDEFFENPTGKMVTVKCDPWYAGGRALLLGDAAHAIVPFFGQGMNCGFEDVTVLEELWGEEGDWTARFKRLFESRKPNTDAIADLAVENFVEMRDKVGNPQFLLERAVEKLLEKEFPGKYYSRYALVTFSRVPYQLARDAGVKSEGILRALCENLKLPEAFDRALAGKLIQERLQPLLRDWKIP